MAGPTIQIHGSVLWLARQNHLARGATGIIGKRLPLGFVTGSCRFSLDRVCLQAQRSLPPHVSLISRCISNVVNSSTAGKQSYRSKSSLKPWPRQASRSAFNISVHAANVIQAALYALGIESRLPYPPCGDSLCQRPINSQMTGFETHLGNLEYPVTKEIHLGIHYPISLQ